MRCIGKLSRDKRGIGSLVGASFLILILLSGFAFYMLSVNVTDEYRETLRTMDQLDLKRKQEKIEFVSVSTKDEDKLDITVKNTGPYQTHLIWLGVFDETTSPPTQKYYPLEDIYINPAETEANIGLDEMGEDVIIEGNEYTIQLVTELGNTFIYSYPPKEEGPPGLGEITITGPDTIPWKEWETYNIKVTDASGDPIPYARLIVYGDPKEKVDFQGHSNPFTNFGVADANGEFALTLRAKYDEGQTITLYVVVGSLVGKEEIVQLPKPV